MHTFVSNHESLWALFGQTLWATLVGQTNKALWALFAQTNKALWATLVGQTNKVLWATLCSWSDQ